jgi:hypothetical protein
VKQGSPITEPISGTLGSLLTPQSISVTLEPLCRRVLLDSGHFPTFLPSLTLHTQSTGSAGSAGSSAVAGLSRLFCPGFRRGPAMAREMRSTVTSHCQSLWGRQSYLLTYFTAVLHVPRQPAFSINKTLVFPPLFPQLIPPSLLALPIWARDIGCSWQPNPNLPPCNQIIRSSVSRTKISLI